MGVFNFIETFFFISLGITFVLILLLVYHFKQRLNVLEQKGDTMFDIINNIVKEINMVKHVTAMHFNANPNPTMSHPTMSHPTMSHPTMSHPTMSHPTMSHNESYLGSIKEYVPPTVYKKENIHTEIDDSGVESEDDESEDDESEDDESDDDESEDDKSEDDKSEDDESEDDESEVKSVKAADNKKIMVSDDDEVTVEKPSDKNIKIINVDINAGEHLEQIHEIQIEELNVDDDASESNADFQGIESSESSIAVSKLDSAAPDTHMNAADSETVKTTAIDMYNKMSLAELKALVIQKGLSTDPGKMKRPKIITLLESALD